ncbi:MAG: amidohydrolase family protein [Candidatus Lokiarchaeota archaeon]|nr:amidohydrolase family protein [Candidatus Lokiarchaeota archaeon]MBD3199821.1 amidohydrolase family protein [Candidatus Lokiarchaeota archaeon]
MIRMNKGINNKKIFYNGTIITIDESNPIVEAVGVIGDKIHSIGSFESVKSKLGTNYEGIDLNGKTMLPGFIDSHLHPIAYLFFLFNLDLAEIKSLDELKDTLKKTAADRPKDELILGLSLKEEDFTDSNEQKLPNRWDLDEACPDHPVFLLRYDGHIGIANTKALELAEIDESTEAPEGGEIRRDKKGRLTGVLSELAASLVLSKVSLPNPEIIEETAKKAFNYFACKGLTSLHGVVQIEAGAEMGDMGAFEVPILKSIIDVIPQNWYSLVFAKKPRKLKRIKKPPLDGGTLDSQFKVGCLKIFADGTYGSATALMHEPFSDQPDKSGFMVINEDTLYERMKKGHNLGFQIGIHTIGDKGNRIVVDLYKKLLQEFPKKDHRHRIEHASSLTLDVIEDMAELNIIASCQPQFINSEYKWLPKRLGKKRLKDAYPIKTLINKGVIVASGSDCPIEDPDVIMGLHALVTRNGFVPDECISIEEALKTFTINGAYAAFEEDIKGSIEEGKLADFVILDKNPLETPKNEIKNIQVVETIIRGKSVFRKD